MKKLLEYSLFLVLIHLSNPQFASAHGAGSRILGDNKAVTAEFYYSDSEPMSYAKVLVFSPQDQKTEYQNGRTDRQGRFAFYPDTPGTWRIEANDGMGHKAQCPVEVSDVKADEKKAEKQIPVRNSSISVKCISGLSLIFNIFFVIYLWKRKKD